MNKSIFFLTLDMQNSPYFTTYFGPLVHSLSQDDDYVVIHLIRSDSTKTQFRNLVRIQTKMSDSLTIDDFSTNRLGDLFGLLKALIKLKKLVNPYETTVIYRSFGGALLLLFLRILRFHFSKYIYDSDGLAIDEKIETNVLKEGTIKYFILTRLEKYGISMADSFVARSSETIGILHSRSKKKISLSSAVLKNGRTISQFEPFDESRALAMRNSVGIAAEDFVVVYSGSLGPQYRAEDMMLIFEYISSFIAKSKFLVLANKASVASHLPAGTMNIGKSNQILLVDSVNPMQIQNYLEIADVGLCLRSNAPSMRHVAPLKFREYLFSGVPCVVTSNTADTFVNWDDEIYLWPDKFLEDDLSHFEFWIKKIRENRGQIRERCRSKAIQEFNIDEDVSKLRKLL